MSLKEVQHMLQTKFKASTTQKNGLVRNKSTLSLI